MELRVLVRSAGMAAMVLGVLWAAGCLKKEPITYGTITDARDGQTYKTVRMPDGKIWMAGNLNYRTDSSWCYDNADSNCAKYGRMYDWNAAMTACPAGYHLPSRTEWDSLVRAAGGKPEKDERGIVYWLGAGKRLKARSGWTNNGNGVDSYGFSALPGGERGAIDDKSYRADEIGAWWTSSAEHNDFVAYYSMHHKTNIAEVSNIFSWSARSVRCVADAK